MLETIFANCSRENFLDQLKKLNMEYLADDLGFLDWDVRKGITTWDKTWAELFGLPSETLVGTAGTWEKTIHPNDLPEVIEKLNDHLASRTPEFVFEYRLNPDFSSRTTIRTCGIAVERNDRGRPLRVIMISQEAKSQEDVFPQSRVNPWSYSPPPKEESSPSP